MEFRKLVNTLKFSYKFDNDLPREFVKKILLDSEFTVGTLVNAMTTAIDNPPSIKVTKDTSLELATAILGVSLALMCSGGSGFMTAAQGKKDEKLCRKSIDKDFGFTLKKSNFINERIDEYMAGYKKSWSQRTNPFNQPAGILIMNIFGKNYKSAMTPDGNLQYLVHQITMDQLMLLMVPPNKMWKL